MTPMLGLRMSLCHDTTRSHIHCTPSNVTFFLFWKRQDLRLEELGGVQCGVELEARTN